MYDDIIQKIEGLGPSNEEWTTMRTLAGLAGKPRHDTARSHIMWLRRKAKRGEGLSDKHRRFHQMIASRHLIGSKIFELACAIVHDIEAETGLYGFRLSFHVERDGNDVNVSDMTLAKE